MPIKARRCFVPLSPSDWVSKVFLTCDNQIAVQFKYGQRVKKILPHGPGAYLGHGGVPQVCCLYPGTQGELAETLYELAQVWSYAGEWVHGFLYKKFGYQLVAAPALCGSCNTQCSIQLDPASPSDGQNVTITVTVTNTDGSATQGAAPQGTVTIRVDGSTIATLTLPNTNPDGQNYETVSTNWTATCTPGATHTVEASFTPTETDFAGTSCSATVTVTGCGIQTTCCPSSSLPETLHVTISNVSGCACLAGTYALTYGVYFNGFQNVNGWGMAAQTLCGQTLSYLVLWCNNTTWSLTFIGNTVENITGFTVNCDTPSWTLTGYTVLFDFCAGGTINITITE